MIEVKKPSRKNSLTDMPLTIEEWKCYTSGLNLDGAIHFIPQYRVDMMNSNPPVIPRTTEDRFLGDLLARFAFEVRALSQQLDYACRISFEQANTTKYKGAR